MKIANSIGLYSQSHGFFSVVMYRCESWTIKNAEHQRIDAFQLWCWKLLRVPSTAEIKPVSPKGNQPWIFIGRTDAEAPILRSPDEKSWLIGKDPDAGKDWEQEEKGDGCMASPTQWTWVWVSFRCWWWTGKPGMLQSMIHRVRHDWINEVDCTWYDCISVSPTCPLLLSFHPLLWRLFSSCFLALFRGNYPIFRYILYLREMVLSTILNLPQWLFLNDQI